MNTKKWTITSLFFRSFSLQSLWNFEGMQNAGFLYTIYPVLRSLYPDPEKRKEALLRHLDFFNTHPYMASIVIGLIAKLEEQKSEGAQVSSQSIEMLKRNMAGPLAAMGDAFFWASFRTFVALIAIGLYFLLKRVDLVPYYIMVPISFIVIYNVVHIGFRYWGLYISYKLSDKIIEQVASIKFQEIISKVRIILAVMLALVAVVFLTLFAFNTNWLIFFVVMFAFTLLWQCAKKSDVALFYLVIGLSIGFAAFISKG